MPRKRKGSSLSRSTKDATRKKENRAGESQHQQTSRLENARLTQASRKRRESSVERQRRLEDDRQRHLEHYRFEVQDASRNTSRLGCPAPLWDFHESAVEEGQVLSESPSLFTVNIHSFVCAWLWFSVYMLLWPPSSLLILCFAALQVNLYSSLYLIWSSGIVLNW